MKKELFCGFAAVALAIVLSAPTGAQLASYSQDFEGLNQADPAALTNDGWLVFGNVFAPNFAFYLYGYGPFPAPNGGPGFCAVASGAGGPAQGAQQLVVYSDYNNGDHAFGNLIEANVFQEQIVGAADAGSTWLFEFEAKRDNIDGGSTATAFFKTLDPNAGFALTNFITVDMTNTTFDWTPYSLSIFIDPALEGQILQFGFLNVATNYEGSGILYDNINFDVAPLAVDFNLKPESCPNPLNTRSQGVYPMAVMGSADFDVEDIDVSSLRIGGLAPERTSYEDVGDPYAGAVCGCADTSPDGWLDLTIKYRTQDLLGVLGTTAPGSHALTLTGTLLDGTPIEGTDCVTFVGGRAGRAQGIQMRKVIRATPVTGIGVDVAERN